MKNKLIASYLAGFIDCDGSFSKRTIRKTTKDGIEKSYLYTVLSFHSADKAYLSKIAKMLSDIVGEEIRAIKTNKKRCNGAGVYKNGFSNFMYRININRHDDIEKITKTVLPYLVFKKEKAKEILKIIEDRQIKKVSRWRWKHDKEKS